MTEINAKFRYVSDVRKLKTYGITSFEVQQKEEGKKKPGTSLCFVLIAV